MMISPSAASRAARLLYCAVFADVFEEYGGSWGPGTEITQFVQHPLEEHYRPLIYTLIGRLWQAWGMDPGLVFWHMNNGVAPDDRQAGEWLYYLFMSCMGHGVGIRDDYSEAFDQAIAKLQIRCERPHAPFHFEDNEWRDLADRALHMGGSYLLPPGGKHPKL